MVAAHPVIRYQRKRGIRSSSAMRPRTARGEVPPAPVRTRVSGSRRAAAIVRARPSAASTTKAARHDQTVSTTPPTSGATTGPTELTTASVAKRRLRSAPVEASPTMARAETAAAAPPRPCTTRARISVVASGEIAQTMLARVKRAVPARRMRRRPAPSLIGPMTSCPTANATRKAVNVSCTDAVEASRSAAMAGRPGM